MFIIFSPQNWNQFRYVLPLKMNDYLLNDSFWDSSDSQALVKGKLGSGSAAGNCLYSAFLSITSTRNLQFPTKVVLVIVVVTESRSLRQFLFFAHFSRCLKGGGLGRCRVQGKTCHQVRTGFGIKIRIVVSQNIRFPCVH